MKFFVYDVFFRILHIPLIITYRPDKSIVELTVNYHEYYCFIKEEALKSYLA